jgi:hypothetical protein
VPAFGGVQDFRQLQHPPGTDGSSASHVEQVDRDLDLLYDNILEHGWAL